MTVLVPEYGRWPAEVSLARRDTELPAKADAAVLVSPDCPTDRLVKTAGSRGVPMHVAGAEVSARVRPVRAEVEPERRGLPD